MIDRMLKHFDFLIVDYIVMILSMLFGYYIRHGNLQLLHNPLYRNVFFASIFINLLQYVLINVENCVNLW